MSTALRHASGVVAALVLAALLTSCGGGDPTEGDDGAQGATGKNALMTVSAEPGGGHCAVSGSKIDAGLDVNANGLLDASEISNTQYLCSGTAGGGANALVQMLDEPSGTNCAAGGKVIDVGLDGNANGVLEASEVSSSGFVCNGSGGANGLDGANGRNGANGLSTLISIASEPMGANCAYGGIKISSAATTNYSCNGAPSADLNWVIVDDADSPKQALRNTNYLANGDAQVVLTLPADADISIGEVVRINGAGAGGWKIAQNAGQAVYTKNLGGTAGAIWIAHEPSGSWFSIASSADGNKLVAAGGGSTVYTSSNGGATWMASSGPKAAPTADWNSVASSGDGSKLVALANYGAIYTSNDGGANWDASSGPNAAPSDQPWRSAAFSADGSKVVAVLYGSTIYTTSDSGANWTPNAVQSDSWSSVASSADGTKLVAVADNFGEIYTSSNSGASWTPSRGPHAAPRALWRSVASSADGSKLVAVAYGGNVYTSIDRGANWAASSGPHAAPRALWRSVASSADGNSLAAVAGNMAIFISNDGGANWAARESGRSWRSIASSTDGSKLAAVVNGGQIYTSIATTALGTTGSISGASSDAIELQYVGNSMFTVLSHSGSLTIR